MVKVTMVQYMPQANFVTIEGLRSPNTFPKPDPTVSIKVSSPSVIELTEISRWGGQDTSPHIVLKLPALDVFIAHWPHPPITILERNITSRCNKTVNNAQQPRKDPGRPHDMKDK